MQLKKFILLLSKFVRKKVTPKEKENRSLIIFINMSAFECKVYNKHCGELSHDDLKEILDDGIRTPF